jgi:hypothetical protein
MVWKFGDRSLRSLGTDEVTPCQPSNSGRLPPSRGSEVSGQTGDLGDLGTAHIPEKRPKEHCSLSCAYSLAALSILASRGAAIKKCALLRRRPISGFIAVRDPARFARNSIPRTPVTARPVLEASWRPSCSSMSTISALSSVAKAMAPAAHLSQWSTGQRFAKREPLPYEAAFLAGKGFSS